LRGDQAVGFTVTVLIVPMSEAIRGLLAFGVLTAVTAVGATLLAGANARAVWRLRALAAVEIAAAALWIAEDKPFEVRVLWRLTENHGVTEGDLAALAPVAIAVLLLVASRRPRREEPNPVTCPPAGSP
jgi:hypothetical protein